VKRAVRLVARALRLRCPACGGASLFAGVLRPRERCPSCGLRLEREEGYYLGAMLLNVLVAELLFIVGFAVALVQTWPHPPWAALTLGSVVGVVVLPFALYPFARALWLAFDLLVQPTHADEYLPPSESPAARQPPS
jgi:uncharacterized protein (DUF983 family)